MSFNFNLPGSCLITGAASGIGRGTSIVMAQEACLNLFLCDIDVQGLEMTKALVEQANPAAKVVTQRVDVADPASVQDMVDGCAAVYGRIDYALNIAGVAPMREKIAEIPVATYDKVIGVNEYGTWLCHRAEIAQMMKQAPLPDHDLTRGSIVTVASLAGLNASSGMSTYCASKHAIVGFSKTDAQDYGPHGVRINVVCPGMIDTDLFRLTSPPEAPAQLAAITPTRRLGQPGDVARLMAFLCSTKASFMQGAVIPVDGGLVLQRGVI